MLHLCIEGGNGKPRGCEGINRRAALFIFFVHFKIITYWSREFLPPFDRKGGDAGDQWPRLVVD